MTDRRRAQPRCAIARCHKPAEPVQDMPCAYFCEEHKLLPIEQRLKAFHELIENAPPGSTE